MSMGGSEETRSIVYLDYWASAAGQRWRSSRSDPSLLALLLRRSLGKGLACFAPLIEQPEFPRKSGSSSHRSVDI